MPNLQWTPPDPNKILENGKKTKKPYLPKNPDQVVRDKNSNKDPAAGDSKVEDQAALEIAFSGHMSAEIVREVLYALVLNKRMPNLPGAGAEDDTK